MASFLSLPPELMVRIASHLPQDSRLSLADSCGTWRSATVQAIYENPEVSIISCITQLQPGTQRRCETRLVKYLQDAQHRSIRPLSLTIRTDLNIAETIPHVLGPNGQMAANDPMRAVTGALRTMVQAVSPIRTGQAVAADWLDLLERYYAYAYEAVAIVYGAGLQELRLEPTQPDINCTDGLLWVLVDMTLNQAAVAGNNFYPSQQLKVISIAQEVQGHPPNSIPYTVEAQSTSLLCPTFSLLT